MILSTYSRYTICTNVNRFTVEVCYKKQGGLQVGFAPKCFTLCNNSKSLVRRLFVIVYFT